MNVRPVLDHVWIPSSLSVGGRVVSTIVNEEHPTAWSQ